MRNWKKNLGNMGIISCGILLFFFQLVVIILVSIYTKKNVVKGIIENFISEKADTRITIGQIDYRLSPFILKAGSIAYSYINDQGKTDVYLRSLTLYGDIKK